MKALDFKKTGTGFLFVVLMGAGQLMAGEPWEKIGSESGIDLYERWVKVDNNLTVKERRGEMIIKGSVNSVINTLTDPSKTKLWMENVSDSYLIEKESEQKWMSYTYFRLPWPLENRDLVSVSNLRYNNPGTATIEMVSNENALPMNENVVRLIKYKATWKIADLGNGDVYISFSAMTATPPQYPRFVLDPVVRGAFLRNLIKLRVILSNN